MMDCAGVEKNLASYVDRELSDKLMAEVEKHLEKCPNCKKLFLLEKSIKGILSRKIVSQKSPPYLKEKILKSISSEAVEDAEKRPLGLFAKFRSSPMVASAVGVAIFAAILIVVVLLFMGNKMLPFISDVYAHHIDDKKYPCEIKETDCKRISALLTDRVQFKVVVPDLKGQKYKLLGGRKCRLCGKLMAFVRYKKMETALSLCIIKCKRIPISKLEKTSKAGKDYYYCTKDNCTIIFWRDDDITYCIAAELPSEELLELAVAARSQ